MTLTYLADPGDLSFTTQMPFEMPSHYEAVLEVDGVEVWRGKAGDLVPPDVQAKVEALRRAPRGIAWPSPEFTAMTEG